MRAERVFSVSEVMIETFASFSLFLWFFEGVQPWETREAEVSPTMAGAEGAAG